MRKIDETAIKRVASGVIDCTLPKSEWTHAGHFAAALWLCRHRRDLTEADEIRMLISRYNEATNTANTDTGGYHHTVTLASMRGAGDFLASYPEDVPLSDVHYALMASRYGDPDWLLKYWSREVLFSVSARRGWVDPDLSSLPF
ncbi:hypothetical protein [Croceicoccus sp. YJ47]|uniref:hypothetical protein n=1 Tax=Croceicoccus sp. YJ47 TaxID=2798724 RepID=UPI0019245FCF|nr:hypothetical protein [Croceicoccus sp. YJ47]QQN74368.1 hypothetical protein JD971_00745 [Croceicoccus sp. YJ47]